MKACIRATAVTVTAFWTAVALAACGAGAEHDSEGGNGPRIGVLLPDATTARWETRDRPLLEKKIKELCDTCTVEHANAKGDVALQQEQMDSMITKGVDAILLVAVDGRSLGPAVAKAQQADIPVIAYDRLSAGPISGYVSFDGKEVGRLQGRALLKAMGDKVPGGQIVMMNGDPSDPNAVAFKEGALSVLDGRVKIGKAYDTLQWRTETAHMNMSGALSALGAESIDGVYAANDGLAAGSISALKANKVDPLPPVTGQDAELAALRRIVAGEQYMTVSKPFGPEAAAGGAMAVAAARGEGLDGVSTGEVRTDDGKTVPAVLLTPVSVTAGNLKETVLKEGLYTVQQICIPQLRTACDRVGLT
ncbi:substrate-binding domain-containing protein [Streptomyces sp. NBC_01275]|uniref:sugar ABC transporter substrate-binding protein n=1 Tax=Streptomyces sp. NBC_01275 TaxID=2903807 RepID=UPI0022542C7C|nr:substrate-binding domain-containing protein [Streptomyces sp. NBC_01275]MCX4759773.1 substrate-binding domain-containing protein [Streptomyces sp. NBC_01275]